MADTFEQILCVKNEVFVYQIMARVTNRGYRAAEWKLDEPEWTGRLKVVLRDKYLRIRLEDKNSGELFAECPVESYPSEAIEQVLDSSRYFVIRISDESGRNAFIGIGFADRGDSFDLLVAIQDHFKLVKREEKQASEAIGDIDGTSGVEDKPKLDLSLKQGQTIKLNLTTKKNPDGTARPRVAPTSGSILLPPPPGGSRQISKPPSNIPQTNTDLLVNFDASPPTQKQQNTSTQNSNTHSLNNPFGTDDAWQDFTSAPTTKPSKNTPVNWVNFD